MAEIEKIVPIEGMQAPLDVRLNLREMFGRWLFQPENPVVVQNVDDLIDEMELLELCKYYRIEYVGAADDLADKWDKSKERLSDGGPLFSELRQQGWVSFDGARWVMLSPPIGTLYHIKYPSSSTQKFLEELNKVRFVKKIDTPPSNIRDLANRISNENRCDRHISTKNTKWLINKIWQNLCSDIGVYAILRSKIKPSKNTECNPYLKPCDGNNNDVIDMIFLEWCTWCNIFKYCGEWNSLWSPIEKRYCREAAFRILERQEVWGGWSNDIVDYFNLLEQTYSIPQGSVRYLGCRIEEQPKTLVAKVSWLETVSVESIMTGRLMMEHHCPSSIYFSYRLILSELELINIGEDIIETRDKLLSFSVEHPMALQELLDKSKHRSLILSDILMCAQTTSLAIKLILQWKSNVNLNSNQKSNREMYVKMFAIQDSLSLLGYYLKAKLVDLDEVASLITWCYMEIPNNQLISSDIYQVVGRQILVFINNDTVDYKTELLQCLVEQVGYISNVPRACFSGILNALNIISDTQNVDTLSMVTLYTKFAYDMKLEWTDSANLSPELSMQLVIAASSQKSSVFNALLIPFDSVARMSEAKPSESMLVRNSIADTLRTHIRLLARAISAWPDNNIPLELSNALKNLTSYSTIEHNEKGRIGALTDRYRPNIYWRKEKGSPAEDLVAAWKRLASDNQECLLRIFNISDDPVFLAELCQHLPAHAKISVQSRLQQLNPKEASVSWTWSEIEHRIESLLNAGEVKLAREHFDVIKQELTRAPLESQLGLFNLELRLILKEENWELLDNTIVPSGFDKLASKQSQNQLDFYNATSQLLRPNGDLVKARNILQHLSDKNKSVSAYQENMFAVAIRQIIGEYLHPLEGEDIKSGESLLEKINIVIDSNPKSNRLIANRALLMFSLQRPEDAFKSLAHYRIDIRDSDIEYIAILAKLEMGCRSEAMQMLDSAIIEFEGNKQLVNLKKIILSGESTLNMTYQYERIQSECTDVLEYIRGALQQLMELYPSQVGKVFCPSGDGFRDYLIHKVSAAVASLQYISAMLRPRGNLKDNLKFEDDLNSAVRIILDAHLSFVKWSASDQSLGGQTSVGNPGERDIVIKASGQELAIYEALVCKGVEKTNIKKHFDKLLRYGQCSVYFLVVYSYAKNTESIFEYIKEMLEDDTPSGLLFNNVKQLNYPDYATNGYLATYHVNHQEIAVAFLLVDLNVEK